MISIQLAMTKLSLVRECLDGKLELGLPWNPFAISAEDMETSRINLQRTVAISISEEQRQILDQRKGAHFNSGEIFLKDRLFGKDC